MDNITTHQVAQNLTWALVIPTYKRETILPRCLRLAAQQTFPPKEIIVVDASPYWEKTRAQIMQELASQYPTIEWKYVQAKRASLPTQRNQGVDLASADILFLIDDDSLMYLDCAEEIMKVYALDTEHKIVGIMPVLEPSPPERKSTDSFKPIGWNKSFYAMVKSKQQTILFKVKTILLGLLKDSTTFPPYTSSIKYELPDILKNSAVHGVPNLLGWGMTFRQHIFKQIHFEETLERYAIHEDVDFSYRARTKGMLLRALNARICHLQASGGRLSKFTVEALSALNIIILHRINNIDFENFEKAYPTLLRRRIISLFIKDMLVFRWSFPSMRGALLASRHYKEIFAKTPEELKQWYPQFQSSLIAQNNR